MVIDDPGRPARRRGPVESERVLADDLLVEAARAGWLREDAPDPVSQVLALLRGCAAGSCPCVSRERCPIRATKPS